MGFERSVTIRMVSLNSNFSPLAFKPSNRIEDQVALRNLGLSIYHLIKQAHARGY
jgi:hypothetical protein